MKYNLLQYRDHEEGLAIWPAILRNPSVCTFLVQGFQSCTTPWVIFTWVPTVELRSQLLYCKLFTVWATFPQSPWILEKNVGFTKLFVNSYNTLNPTLFIYIMQLKYINYILPFNITCMCRITENIFWNCWKKY